MYNNPYASIYNPQASIDRINNQIAELEKMKQQIPQAPVPTNLTQNFQLAPSNQNAIRYANSIDDVSRAVIIGDTPFFSNDMSVVWLKNIKGDIKTYELNEIVPKDSKDLIIEDLQMQLDECKRRLNNEQHASDDVKQHDETSSTENDVSVGTTTKEDKSSSLSGLSTSKKK